MAASSDTSGAIPPPPGVTPHLGEHSVGKRRVWVAATTVTLAIPTLFVAARVFVKIHLRRWTLADYACMVAWAFTGVITALAFDFLDYGEGSHAWNLSPTEFSRFLWTVNVAQIMYQPGMFFTKTAIFLQLYEIFCVGGTERLRKGVLFGAILINAIFLSTLFFATIFNCTPRKKIWHPEISGSCLNNRDIMIANGVLNIADYLVLSVLPMTWIWKLNMARTKKFKISAIFATMVLACSFSIVRLAESIIRASNPDVTYAFIPVSLWAAAEPAAGVVVCCLPVVPAFFRICSALRTGNSSPAHSGNVLEVRDRSDDNIMSPESLIFTSYMPTETRIGTTTPNKDDKSRQNSDSSEGSSRRRDLSVPDTAIVRSVRVEVFS